MGDRSPYRPTTLRLVSDHCPRALDFHEAGAPYDRSVFGVGTAAHICLQALGEATNAADRELDEFEVEDVARAAAEELLSNGREFDGDHEAPPPLDAVLQGRDLAVGYVRWNPLSPGGLYEVGLAMDAEGMIAGYSTGARFRAILDRVEHREELTEESCGSVIHVTDYKSAWSAGPDLLRSIQMRAQAVLAWKKWGKAWEADSIILEIVNLRTGNSYSREIGLSEWDLEKLWRWDRDIRTACDTLDGLRSRDGSRPAYPGHGCIGCPYLRLCDHAQDYMERAGMHRTDEERARAYCVAVAEMVELRGLLKAAADHTSVEIDGGSVGYSREVRLEPRDDAYAQAVAAWEEQGGDLAGYARAAGLTNGGLKGLSSRLYPSKSQSEDRAAWVRSLQEERTFRRFGVERAQEDSA